MFPTDADIQKWANMIAQPIVEAINDLRPIETDAAKLRQILVNLTVNAQHALEEISGPHRLVAREHESHRARETRTQRRQPTPPPTPPPPT